ncbi:phage baseplate assembly protein V [Leptolyngbya sp. AN02str]|uniref:phage baseplate assembly protein V n=1 Tax=Leptolyngbya sp. AN02str TaxID=3423363 RepID=UPI003D3201CA
MALLQSMSDSIFEVPLGGLLQSHYLAEVVSVNDANQQARVQVRLLNFDGVDHHDGPIWARVATPFAGASRGAFFLPDVGDEVLVAFISGDPRQPVVIGSLWNGKAAPPERLGGDRVDRWTLVGKAGTRIAIVEAQGTATIALSTPGGVSINLTDEGGGKVELVAAGNTVKLDSSGVSIQTGAKVSVQASQVQGQAGQVSVDSALSKFSGVVKCDVQQATTVIASTYTPGAGNVW